MKKIVLAVLLASGLMAAENADYFGLSVGNAKLSGSASASGVSANLNTDGTQYTVTLGHYYDDNGRVSGSYTYADLGNGVDKSDAFSLAYDFILPLVENRFSLYAGPVIGYTRYEESGIDLSGFHYGAQAGGLIRLTNKVELEAGYRYLIETGSETVSSVNVDADYVQMWYVGANLRF